MNKNARHHLLTALTQNNTLSLRRSLQKQWALSRPPGHADAMRAAREKGQDALDEFLRQQNLSQEAFIAEAIAAAESQPPLPPNPPKATPRSKVKTAKKRTPAPRKK